jgi:protocatechuate 3,4-dioxygenase, alpha subunit
VDSNPTKLPPTPAQTVGPYFGMALTPEGSSRLVPKDHPDAIVVSGKLTDGAGAPVKEGMIEIWQAGTDGTYPDRSLPADDAFTGFGTCHAGDDGSYQFITLKPGPVPAPGGGNQAPHINIAVNGLGILKPLRTRIYFSDEAESNAEDPVLQSVDEERRALLIALFDGQKATFDITLQGENETPFFKV